jgi:anthrone oxygenase-like protein
MLAGQLALTIVGVFTGAAIYINIGEQPARLQLDDRSVLVEWKLAYKRGYVMQASLVIMGGLLGLVAFLSTLEWRWLLGAVGLLANWPYTIFVIMPTNRRLMDTPPEAATAETRRMMRQWGILHAGRSALGLVSTLIFLWAQQYSYVPRP